MQNRKPRLSTAPHLQLRSELCGVVPGPLRLPPALPAPPGPPTPGLWVELMHGGATFLSLSLSFFGSISAVFPMSMYLLFVRRDFAPHSRGQKSQKSSEGK